MANFGIGLGAFADGFARGYGIRRQINRDKREDRKAEREEQREQAMAQAWQGARSAYDSAVADDVLTQAGKADPNKPFNAEKAGKDAESRIGSFSDFVYTKQLPKIIDTALAQGDFETAEKLRKWADDAGERKRTELFGSALNDFYAGQASGNYTAFADKAMRLLNDGGYGTKATGYEFVKDSEGNTSGITFKLKEGDREYEHTFNSMQDVGTFLAGQADPRSRVQMFQGQVAEASKFKAKMAEEQAKAQIGLGKDIALEDHKHQNKLQLEAAKSKQTGSKIQQDYEFMTGVLKSEGFSDEEIKPLIPAMLKLTTGEYRKGRSPEEFAQQLTLELMKDYAWAKKSPEEIQARVHQLLEIVRGAAEMQRAAQPSPGAQPGITGQSGVPVLR